MPKTAIITGASRGIGRAIAERLAKDGVRVALCARDQKALDEVAGVTGGVAIAADLREKESAGRVIEVAVKAFGAIDIVVNNAGATKRGEFEELSEEDWMDGFALKFFGAVRVTRAAWPYLKRQSGSVVNIAGIGGRTPGAQFAIGGSVNAAMLSFTKALADVGVRDGVQVNAINPGSVRTDRLARRLQAEAARKGIDLDQAARQMVEAANARRIGEPEDIANLVAFIVSPAGSFLQGALIDMDGGQTKTI